jgi:outer membrane lipoprotein SlyB
MALVDVQEQVRAALYDTIRLQFVVFQRVAVDLSASGAVIGQQGGAVVAGFTGADLGDHVLFGGEAAFAATCTLGVPTVSVAGSVSFRFTVTNAAGLDPASNTCRVTVLRAM